MQVLDQLVDVRVALESDMARTAAESMTDADLTGLAAILEELRTQLRDPGAYLRDGHSLPRLHHAMFRQPTRPFHHPRDPATCPRQQPLQPSDR